MKIESSFILVHPEKLQGILFIEFINRLEMNYEENQNRRPLVILTSKESEFTKMNISFENFEEMKGVKDIRRSSFLDDFMNEIKMYNKGKDIRNFHNQKCSFLIRREMGKLII